MISLFPCRLTHCLKAQWEAVPFRFRNIHPFRPIQERKRGFLLTEIGAYHLGYQLRDCLSDGI
jgi:hypothetical protein